MNRLLLAVFLIMVTNGFGIMQTGGSPDGFVVWSEGDNCRGELKYQKLEKDKGPVGEKKTAVNKAEGADIMVVISFDGKWIAFARFIGTPGSKYFGPCDYHSYDKLDVYIARIDGALPAKPIKIAHGYWPSWGEDSKQANKTLYFTRFSDQTIQKTTVNPDGSFTAPGTHATCLKKVPGTSAHTQGSPDGKYIAYRPAGMKVQDIAANKNIPGAGGGGCHPCWGPRSRYLIWARNIVCVIKGDTGRTIGKAGFGNLYYGVSNDAHYDQARLWAVGAMSGSSNNMNVMSYVVFKPIDISNDGWEPRPGTKVSNKGTWCDIHVGTVPVSVGRSPGPENGYVFKPLISPGTKGLQLVIEPHGLEAYAAGLYNMQGKQKVFINLAGPSRSHIPLRGIADGMYVIKLNTAWGSVQKAVRIAR